MSVSAVAGTPQLTDDRGTGSVRMLGRIYTHQELGWFAVWSATMVFVVVFWRSSLAMHARFLTNSFDLGIFSQGLYLLSRFEEPFVTLRGLNLFADHSSYIMLPMVPLYWIWADVRMLILFTVVILAAGAPIVYATGRRLGIAPPAVAPVTGVEGPGPQRRRGRAGRVR